MNLALLFKVVYWILNDEGEMGKFLNKKFKTPDGKWINYHKNSSIWSGFRWEIGKARGYFQCMIGDGTSINIWRNLGQNHLQWLNLFKGLIGKACLRILMC